MASVPGALSNVVTLDVHPQTAAPSDPSSTDDSTNMTFPVPATLSTTLDTVSGVVGRDAHNTVGGAYSQSVSGFDTVPGHANFAVSNTAIGGTDNVVATQATQSSGVTVHFTDGSSLTVAGVTHLHAGFFH